MNVSRHGMNREGTVKPQITMPDELWRAAQKRAAKETKVWGTQSFASDVVRRALKRYLQSEIPPERPLDED